MAEDDARIPRARHPGGVDVLAFSKGQELAANEPRETGPQEEAQHDRETEDSEPLEVLARDLSDDGAEHDDRDDDHEVGEAHEERLDPATVVAGDRADDRPDDHDEDADDEHDDERVLHAAHRHREVVLADEGLAEGVFPEMDTGAAEPLRHERERRCAPIEQLREIGIGVLPPAGDPEDPGRRHREHDDREKEDEGCHRHPVGEESPEDQAALAHALGDLACRLRRRGLGQVGSSDERHQRVLTLGSSAE